MAARLARFSWLPGGLAAAFVIVVGRLISSTAYAPVELMRLRPRDARHAGGTRRRRGRSSPIDDASIAKLGAVAMAARRPRQPHRPSRSAGARVVAFSVPVDTSPRTSEAERLRAALALLESSDLGGSEQAQQLRRLLGESRSGRDPNAHLAQAMAAHGNVVLPADVRLVEHARWKLELPPRLLSIGDAARCGAHARRRRRPPTPRARAGSRRGRAHADPADGDGTVRSDAAALRVGEDALLPSLATAIAARAFGVDAADRLTFNGDGRCDSASTFC